MYEMHVIVPADKGPNNIIIFYEKDYKTDDIADIFSKKSLNIPKGKSKIV